LKEVSLLKLAEYFKLENMTPSIPLDGIYIQHKEINRPALQLAGFYKYFDNERIQLVGKVEDAFMQGIPMQQRLQIWQELFARKIPCLVVCRGLECYDDLIRKGLGEQYADTADPSADYAVYGESDSVSEDGSGPAEFLCMASW